NNDNEGRGRMRGRVVLWGAIAAAQTAAAVEQGSLEALCGECRVERFAECGGFLEGATVAPDGTLWVVDLLSGNVLSIDGRGTCTVRANTGGQPNGAKFHRDGRLFVADKLHGIVAIDPRSGDVTRIVDMHRTERLRGTNDLV